MAWSYDATDLGTDDAVGRLHAVRFLIGDTDINDQQVQNEEIAFALNETSDSIYSAGSFICKTIAAKYSRRVDTELDGALKASYGDLSKKYTKLSDNIESQGKKSDGGSLGIKVGGVNKTTIDTVREDTNRPTPSFYRDRFRIPVKQGSYEVE